MGGKQENNPILRTVTSKWQENQKKYSDIWNCDVIFVVLQVHRLYTGCKAIKTYFLILETSVNDVKN